LSFPDQIRFFHKLVSMFRSSNGSIQNGAKEAVLRLKVCSFSIRSPDSFFFSKSFLMDNVVVFIFFLVFKKLWKNVKI